MLWLAVPGSRPLPASYAAVFGSIKPGVARGGVPSREGWRDVTQLRARQRQAAAGPALTPAAQAQATV